MNEETHESLDLETLDREYLGGVLANMNLTTHEAQVGSGGFPGPPVFRGRCLPGSAGILAAWTARGLEARAPRKPAAPP